MRALDYAILTRPTMGQASDKLISDYRKGNFRLHHVAIVTGYTSVKGDEFASYDGRFGKGLVVFTNYTSRYSLISYYVEVE